MHPFVNTAVKAACRAGNIIVRHLDRLDRIDIEKKGHNDYVSEVDRKAETEILAIIQQAYPDHGIIAEESGRQQGTRYEWIIDPLDGTTNFLHGYPQFAVSIAVREAGALRFGPAAIAEVALEPGGALAIDSAFSDSGDVASAVRRVAVAPGRAIPVGQADPKIVRDTTVCPGIAERVQRTVEVALT